MKHSFFYERRLCGFSQEVETGHKEASIPTNESSQEIKNTFQQQRAEAASNAQQNAEQDLYNSQERYNQLRNEKEQYRVQLETQHAQLSSQGIYPSATLSNAKNAQKSNYDYSPNNPTIQQIEAEYNVRYLPESKCFRSDDVDWEKAQNDERDANAKLFKDSLNPFQIIGESIGGIFGGMKTGSEIDSGTSPTYDNSPNEQSQNTNPAPVVNSQATYPSHVVTNPVSAYYDNTESDRYGNAGFSAYHYQETGGDTSHSTPTEPYPPTDPQKPKTEAEKKSETVDFDFNTGDLKAKLKALHVDQAGENGWLKYKDKIKNAFHAYKSGSLEKNLGITKDKVTVETNKITLSIGSSIPLFINISLDKNGNPAFLITDQAGSLAVPIETITAEEVKKVLPNALNIQEAQKILIDMHDTMLTTDDGVITPGGPTEKMLQSLNEHYSVLKADDRVNLLDYLTQTPPFSEQDIQTLKNIAAAKKVEKSIVDTPNITFFNPTNSSWETPSDTTDFSKIWRINGRGTHEGEYSKDSQDCVGITIQDASYSNNTIQYIIDTRTGEMYWTDSHTSSADKKWEKFEMS